MEKQKADVIASYFENHPETQELHFTSDNLAFFGMPDAQNHTRNLEDKEISTVTRESLAKIIAEAAAHEELEKQTGGTEEASGKKSTGRKGATGK